MKRQLQLIATLFITVLFLTSCDGGGPGKPNPEIIGIQPESGPPGTMVTISGKGFSPDSTRNSVTIGGTSAPVSSASESQIQTEVPDGAESGPVEVTVGDQTASGPTFTVEAKAPGITSVEPDSGTVGTEVTIKGKNFSPSTAENTITFNGTQAPINGAAEDQLKTEVPQGATDGPIKVTVKQKSTTGPDFDVITEGTLEAIISTSGDDKDDGYDFSVGSKTVSIGANGILNISKLEKGSYQAELSDVASNCTVSGNNPRSLNITAGDTTSTTFEVSCKSVLKNQIAFTSDRDGDSEVFVMNADGSNPQKLTDNTTYESNVAVSHDGTKIAFISDRDGSNRDLYVMNADGSNVQRLTSSAALTAFPNWAPDDSKIVFNDTRDGGDPDIYTINAEGGDLTQITSNSHFDQGADWSPDGNKIAFFSGRDGDDEIYLTDGQTLEQLTNNSTSDDFPSWSPDGSKLLFGSKRDGNKELYTMNADGTGVLRLTNNSAYDSGGTWSPNSDKVAFSTSRDGQREVYSINADGSGGLINLTANSAFDSSPSWSPKK